MSSIISSCDNIKRRENTYFTVALSSIIPSTYGHKTPPHVILLMTIAYLRSLHKLAPQQESRPTSHSKPNFLFSTILRLQGLSRSSSSLPSCPTPSLPAAIMGDPRDSSSYKVTPRIRYNTIGGINGPLVIVENVSLRCAGLGRRGVNGG
jgi:hypothetical protein